MLLPTCVSLKNLGLRSSSLLRPRRHFDCRRFAQDIRESGQNLWGADRGDRIPPQQHLATRSIGDANTIGIEPLNRACHFGRRDQLHRYRLAGLDLPLQPSGAGNTGIQV